MTAPAAISEMLSRVAEIQQQIAIFTGTTPTVSTTGSTSSTSSSDFSDVLSGLNSSSSTSSSATATTTPTVTGDDAVSAAEKYLGTPYVWGAESSTGIDCSGLTQASYKSLGITLPRTAAEQQKVGTAVDSLADAKPGDLIFYGNPAHHVAMYIGNGQLVESPTEGQTVHIKNVYGTPSSIRRIIPDGGTTSAVTSSAVTSASSTAASSGISSAVRAYSAQFSAAEAKYHLPTGLLSAVAQQESGGNPNAVSKSGAVGLMQFMPSTAAGLGVNPLDPSSAIDGAGRMYAGLLAKYHGSVPLALAAYNAGSGAVAKYGGIPPYSETENYVKNITALMSSGAKT